MKAKKSNKPFTGKDANTIVANLGKKLATKLKIESLIRAAASRGETSIPVKLTETFNKVDACCLAIFLSNRGFAVQDLREDTQQPRILICWY